MVNRLIDLYHLFDKGEMIGHIIRVMKDYKTPVNTCFAGAVINSCGDKYCLYHIQNDKQGMKNAVQTAYDDYHDSGSGFPEEHTGIDNAEKILVFYSCLMLSGIIRAWEIEKEPEAIVGLPKGRYAVNLVNTIQKLLREWQDESSAW